jgi:hypothetical protein
MARPSRRHARLVLLAAAATFLVAVVMAVAGSGLPPASERSPYATAIVALELARSPAEVLAAVGPPASDAREVLRRVVLIDFAFLVLYPLLSVAVLVFLARGRGWRIAGALAAAAMVAADALENRALLGLLADRSPAPLAALQLWTTVKWSALFASVLLVAVISWARGGLARALALLSLVTAVTGILGLASAGQRHLVEVAGIYGVAVIWVILSFMAMAAFRRSRR